MNLNAAVVDRFAHRIVYLAHYFIDEGFEEVRQATVFILDILDELLYDRHVLVIELIRREDAEDFG